MGNADVSKDELVEATDTLSEREADVVHYFKDAAGGFRWHRIAANGRVISESGEGYEDMDYCLEMAKELNPGILIEPHPE